MKKVFVKDIKENDQVSDNFLVTKKETGVSRTGKPYLILRIMDSTGEIEARVWDDADAMKERFSRDEVCRIKGYAVSYQGGRQINVSDICSLPEDKYSIRDYLPASERDPEEMILDLDRIISGLGDVHIKALLRAIFEDRELRSRFMLAPAAKSMHHPYLGGLLEHVLSMCGLADSVAAHYKDVVDRDLLTAGAILHDIGKIYELEYGRSFGYTDEGRLIGHITIGIELIDSKLRSLADFPPDSALRIKHMLLSHHGRLEFGSPKRPKTIEALVLYYLDDLDAKVNAIASLMKVEDGSDWTPYQRMFERSIFKGVPQKTPEQGPGEKIEDDGPDAGGPGKPDPLSLFK